MKKIGIIIISHGSRSIPWTREINNLVNKLKRKIYSRFPETNLFIENAFLEYSPRLYDAVLKLKKKNIKTIFVAPLFIAPSNHLNNEIPVLLRLNNSNNIAEYLGKTGNRIIPEGLNLSLGRPLCTTNFLKEAFLMEYLKWSKMPEEEELIIFSHGSSEFERDWIDMNETIGEFIKTKTGLSSFTYRFIKSGKNIKKDALPIIDAAYFNKKRVLISAIYLAKSARDIFSNYLQIEKYSNYIKNDKLTFSDFKIISGAGLIEHVINEIAFYNKLT